MTVRIRTARNGKGFEYSIRFRWPDGTPFRERRDAPVENKSGALRWAQARESELLSKGKAALQPPASVVPVVTLAAFWPRFVRDHYVANRKKPSTIDAAQSIFRLHLAELHARPLDQIKTSDVAKIKGDLADRSAKTTNNVLSVLSRALNVAVEWGVIPELSCTIDLLPTEETAMQWYETPEYLRLVGAARRTSPALLVMVLLGGSAGLRRGEIIALKWSDLDLARRMIHVARAIWRDHEETPKGGRGRKVPMTEELHDALKALRALGGPLRGERVIYSEKGRVLSNRTVRNWLAGAQRRADLEPDGGIHRLRHTFCSHLAAAGVPAKSIQELAGHADLATTQRYMHLSPSDRAGAIGRLENYHSEGAKVEKVAVR